MRSVFETFFIIKDALQEEFSKIDAEQKQHVKDRRPIEFNTYK